MNHPSEWKRIYHPRRERYVYKQKGTGVIIDSLFKIGKVVKKPVMNLLKETGRKLLKKASTRRAT